MGRLPIKELTVFKDGHAFVAQEGMVPTDAQGNVSLDQLPTPVIGTFWPFSSDSKARLTGVVAGQHRVLVERTALNLRDLLEANIGAEAIITENGTNRYSATILDLPRRSAEELEATGLPNAGEKLPEPGVLILLKTPDGVRAINLDRIQDVVIKELRPKIASEEFRSLMKLKLDWGKTAPAAAAKVGFFYLQKGVRWVPSYKVTIDGSSNAVIQLQATVINELMDIEDANLNLVVGVPTFAFKDNLDPMAVQQVAAQLSQFFQNDPNGNFRNGTFNNFANSIMSQQQYVPSQAARPAADANPGSGPDLAEGNRSEDLYVFNRAHVTLKKGERMVVTLSEYTLPYQDVFTLELPLSPPMELQRNMNYQMSAEMARILSTPKVMHKIRLANNNSIPLTTGPALILRDGRIVSQAMMTYAAKGATSDLTMATAVDITVKKTDNETGRVANALSLNNSSYSRVDLDGEIMVTSFRTQPTEIEVSRYVLGNVHSASHEGKIEKLNSLEDAEFAFPGNSLGNWYGWPNWWRNANGIGRITWKLKLENGKCAELKYKWDYFWL